MMGVKSRLDIMFVLFFMSVHTVNLVSSLSHFNHATHFYLFDICHEFVGIS